MSTLSLTHTRIKEGIWEGILSSNAESTAIPRIGVSHLEKEIAGMTLQSNPEIENRWVLQVPIPANILSDGVHTFLITDLDTGEKLASFSITAGEPLADDIRAEMDLLREELDMLKRAFRRHCVETT